MQKCVNGRQTNTVTHSPPLGMKSYFPSISNSQQGRVNRLSCTLKLQASYGWVGRFSPVIEEMSQGGGTPHPNPHTHCLVTPPNSPA